jgi:hypothetical protein
VWLGMHSRLDAQVCFLLFITLPTIIQVYVHGPHPIALKFHNDDMGSRRTCCLSVSNAYIGNIFSHIFKLGLL